MPRGKNGAVVKAVRGVQPESFAAVLIEHDPMGLQDAADAAPVAVYTSIAQEISRSISRGTSLASALHTALSARFDDNAVAKADLELVVNNLEWVVTRDGAFRPVIFIDTDFKRTNQSVLTLGYASHERYIELPLDFFCQPEATQEASIRSIICDHMSATGGSLKRWGQIVRYMLQHPDGTTVVYGVDGERSSARG